MSDDSRVVGWQWEHFVNNGLGGGYWIDQSGHEYPEILDQSDLKNPNKYRNMTALVPLSLLAEAESQGKTWEAETKEWLRIAMKYKTERDALQKELQALTSRLEQEQASLQFVQAKLDAALALANEWTRHVMYVGADRGSVEADEAYDAAIAKCDYELRAALGGESPGNEEVR